MNAELTFLVVEIGLLIAVVGFGIRFVIYDEDGPNLDSIYVRYFNGRIRKRHAEFTQTIGWLMLSVAVVYTGFLVWNQFSPLSLFWAGD